MNPALAFALIALARSPGADDLPPARASGQDRLGEPSISTLWASPGVEGELKLSPERIAALDEAVRAAAPDYQKLQNRRRNVWNWVRQGRAAPDELGRAEAALRRAVEAREAAVRALLSEAENRRLFEVAVRRKGIRSLAWPGVADAVRLLPDDIAAIRAILDGREARRDALIRLLQAEIPPADVARYDRIVALYRDNKPVGDDDRLWVVGWWDRRRAHGARVEAFEDEIDAELYRVLTLIQKKRFEALMGAPIDIDQPVPPRR